MENQSTPIVGTLVAAPPKGPPRGNRNSQRHGMRSARLPARCKYVERFTDELRLELEDAVRKATGEVSITAASAISVAVKAETLGALAARWLRLEHDNMDHATRLAYAREVLKAAQARDKAIASLHLESSAHDALVKRLYGGSRKPLEER